MKNKMRYITAAAVISALLLCGCSADVTPPAAVPENAAPVSGQTVQSAETATQASEESTQLSSAESAPETETAAPAAPVTADSFVRVETIETAYGTMINYPVLNAEKLNADDADAANALFEHIKNDLLNDADELRELFISASPQELAELRPPSSETYASLYDGKLSVLMSFRYAFGFPGSQYKSVIFDISTGNAVGSDELVKTASLTDSDVKNSILWATKVYILNQRDELYISKCLYTGTLPEFNSHDGLFNDEKVVCEIALDNYDNGNEYSCIGSEGDVWEKLPLEHTAYLSEEGQLYVFGTTAPTGQIPGKMVAVARGDEETAKVNLGNEFGAIQRKSYIMPEDVPGLLDGIVDPETKPEYRVQSIDSVYDMGEQFPVYVVDVFSGTGFAPALVARYAVSLFDRYIWETDDLGQWAIIA